MNWFQRLCAFPWAYRRNVAEALKISAAISDGTVLGSRSTVYYYAFRITLLTLQRRRPMKNDESVEQRKANDLARLKTIAGEIDQPGTAGMILVPDGNVLASVREYLFPLVKSNMRLYSQTGRRAEFTNGSSVVFRQDVSVEVARGYRLDWVWLVAPKLEQVAMWRGALRHTLEYSRGRFYVGSTEMFISSTEDGIALDYRRRS